MTKMISPGFNEIILKFIDIVGGSTRTLAMRRVADMTGPSVHLLPSLPVYQHFLRVSTKLLTLHELYVGHLQLWIPGIRVGLF